MDLNQVTLPALNVAESVDPSGNVVCLYHAGDNRLNPPWRVVR